MKRNILLALIALTVATHSAPAFDWYRWRGPNTDGISKETGWQSQWSAEGPKQLWTANVGIGFSSVSVSKGRVYTMGNENKQDTVYCFDADTGRPLWKYSYECPLDPKYYEGGPSSTPTVDGGQVFTFSKRGDVVCIDAAKGTALWSTNLMKGLGAEMPTWGFAGSALVEGDLVILNVGSAGAALDKKTGKVVWHSGKDEAGYATPVPGNLGGQRVVLIFAKADLIAVTPKDGKELWKFHFKTTYDVNAADPIISGDRIFMSAGYGHGSAVIRVKDNKPEQLWQNKNMKNHFNSSVLFQGNLYGPDENELACVSFETGEKKWKDKSLGKGSLMMADGKLVALSDRGELMVVEPSAAAFKPISRAQVLSGKCWSVPVLSNGKVYCRNAKGDLVCVDVSSKATASN